MTVFFHRRASNWLILESYWVSGQSGCLFLCQILWDRSSGGAATQLHVQYFSVWMCSYERGPNALVLVLCAPRYIAIHPGVYTRVHVVTAWICTSVEFSPMTDRFLESQWFPSVAHCKVNVKQMSACCPLHYIPVFIFPSIHFLRTHPEPRRT